MPLDRRTNDIEIHERLASIETTMKRIDEKLFGNGEGLVAAVTRHKTYWKLTGRILAILGTASAGAGAAYALTSLF